MADTTKPARKREMSDSDIREVFETLKLPTAPKPVPAPAQQPPTPIIFFTVSGHSPPLKAD